MNSRLQLSPQTLDWLPYPQGLLRLMLRLPIYLYRMGLGGVLDRINILVLTTWGERSGLPRHTAIEYRVHGSKVYLVSFWGERPHWYRNLKAHPSVRVRRGWRSYNARAHKVDNSGEALRVLHLFRKRAPAIYDTILAHLSQRERVDSRSLPEISDLFTIIRLDPSDDLAGPPAVKVDLTWLWLIVGLGMATLLWRWVARVGKVS